MNILDSVVLGSLQGVTEFLPISSSGHLVLAESFMGLDISELKSFDVAVHMGTLFSILAYFRNDVIQMLKAFFRFISFRIKWDRDEKILAYIVVGTVPAVFIGVLFGDKIDYVFRNPFAVFGCMIFTAILFLVAEFVNKISIKSMDNKRINALKSIIIGFFQAVALIPGVSRSGSTISGGLISGLNREEAARFSFLLGIPAIFGAGILTIFAGEGFDEPLINLFIGFAVSGIVGFFSICFLMRFIKKHSLVWFSAYLIIIGGIGLVFG